MQRQTTTISNKLGLHARAAAKLVRVAAAHQSSVTLVKPEMPQPPANAKSIFSVLLLAASQGTSLEIITDGADEEAALQALLKIIADKFGEE